MKILSIDNLKKIIRTQKITYIKKNPYFINSELNLFEGNDTTIIDFLTFYRFNIDVEHLNLKGNTIVINSCGDIKNFINFFERDKFNYLLDKFIDNFKHIVFIIPQKEFQYFNIDVLYFIDIEEENKIIMPIKKQYPYLILPFLSKVANGQISVFSILALLAESPYLRLSTIAKKLGKKPPVIKVYLNRMLEADLVMERDKTYFIPSQYFSQYLLNKKTRIKLKTDVKKKEVENVKKSNDFDYLN